MRPYKHPPADDFLLERILYALSDSIRLGIVRQLASLGASTCGALDGGRPKSTMSHHFKVLREAGVVRTETDGTTHINTLRRDDVDARFPGLLDAILAQPAALSLPAPAPMPAPMPEPMPASMPRAA